jgi:trigger factor
MKSNLQKVSSLERRLQIEIPATMVAAAFDRVFKQVQKQAHLKGFRPGKAPIATIKTVYGDRVKQDVVQDLIEKHYSEALKEHSVFPINYPEFEFDVPTEGQDFAFSASFEVRPEIEVKKYEGLEVKKEAYKFDEAKVEAVLTNIRSSRASQVPVLEDRAAQNGDIAILNFDGMVDGKPLEGGKGTDYPLELGTKSFIDGFEEGVVGMKVGAEKTLHLKFPTPYSAKELEGKAVDFKVVLNKLMKKELPELNDEFLKSIGATETVEQLKETIKKDLEQTEMKRIEQDLKNNILKALVKANPIEVPPSMVRDQKKALVDDMKQKMLDQGMSDAEFVDYTSKWESDFNTTAQEMVQAGFLIDAIAEKEKLRCTPEDIDAKVTEYAGQTGLEEAKIREFYAKPEQQNRLNYSITEDKVIAFLTAKLRS